MKKRLAVIIMAFCMLLITACATVNIWENIDGENREYTIEFDGDSITVVVNKDGSCYNKTPTVRHEYDYDTGTSVATEWFSVADELGEEYAEYDAQIRINSALYGTWKVKGSELNIHFKGNMYTQYDIQGDDAQSFKDAFIANNPDKADIFENGIVESEDEIKANIVLDISGEENRLLQLESYVNGVLSVKYECSYTDDGKVLQMQLSYYYDDVERSTGIKYEYNEDGSWSVTNYQDGLIVKHVEYLDEEKISKNVSYGYAGDVSWVYSTVYTYNDDGKILQVNMYDDNDTVWSRTDYNYNDDGSYTQMSYERYDTDSELQLDYKSEFNTNGICIKSTSYNTNGSIVSQTCRYDNGFMKSEITYYDYEKGVIRSEKYCDEDGRTESKTTYYENGTKESEKVTNEDGSYTEISYFENGNKKIVENYDSDKNLVGNVYYNEDGSVKYENVRYYSTPVYDGLQYEDIVYVDGSSRYTRFYDNGNREYTYVRDSRNKIVEFIRYYYYSGKVQSVDKHDENEILIETIEYYESGNKRAFYKYDSDENVIESVCYNEDGSVKYINAEYFSVDYYDDGSLKREHVQYINGSCEDISYYENGIISNKTIVNNEDGSSAYIDYYENGTVSKEIIYDADGLYRCTHYYEDGTKSEERIEYADGSSVNTSYYENGNINYTKKYGKDSKLKESVYYNEDGSVKYVNVEYISIYESGNQKVETILYIGGKRTTTRFYENGQIQRIDTYVSDEWNAKATDSIVYRENGTVKYEKTTNADGSVTEIYYYENGKAEQKKTTNADGSVTETDYYENGKAEQEKKTNADDSSVTIKYREVGTKSYEYVTNADDSSVTIYYNEDGTISYKIEDITNEDGSSVMKHYHEDGTLYYEKVEKADGSYVSINYDETGRVTGREEYTINKDGSSVKTEYDGTGTVSGWIEYITTAEGVSVTTYYDKNGMMYGRVESTTDAYNSYVTTYYGKESDILTVYKEYIDEDIKGTVYNNDGSVRYDNVRDYNLDYYDNGSIRQEYILFRGDFSHVGISYYYDNDKITKIIEEWDKYGTTTKFSIYENDVLVSENTY